jgi:hypothetical protein
MLRTVGRPCHKRVEGARMELPGLVLGGDRDTGGSIITGFAIAPGRETQAGRDVLACLAAGMEVTLPNDLDEGGEGSTSFRRAEVGFVKQVGGHGWQSGWRPATEADVLAAVVELAARPDSRGSLVRDKRHTLRG